MRALPVRWSNWICGQTPPNYYLYQLYECYTDDPECEQYWVHVCNYTQCQP